MIRAGSNRDLPALTACGDAVAVAAPCAGMILQRDACADPRFP